jgi:uncharacterized protein GlcG (DUF336 family)
VAQLLTGTVTETVINAALAKARELDCTTLTIAVLDVAGQLAGVARLDDRWFQVESAMAKAFAAIALREDTEVTGPKLDSTPFWRTVPSLVAGRGSFGLGGVVLRLGSNPAEVVGAIGVIGGSGAHDLSVAKAGAAALAQL